MAENEAVDHESDADHYEPAAAFNIDRFRWHVGWNDPFAEMLYELLCEHDELPSPLYTLRQKIGQRLNRQGYRFRKAG